MADIGGHILVVDDHRTNRLKMSFAAKKLGHTTEMAKDGQQALALLEQQPVDLAILDIMMPYVDGFTVTKWIRQRSTMPIPVRLSSRPKPAGMAMPRARRPRFHDDACASCPMSVYARRARHDHQ